MVMRGFGSAILVLMAAEVAMAGPLEDAKSAYDGGDVSGAERIYRELANQGDRVAQVQLGLLYDRGDAAPKAYQRAVRWYSVAASQGDPDAAYYLGRLYQDGRGGPRNHARARRWWVQSY